MSKENKTVFEAGDIVDCMGVRGVVVSTDNDLETGYPIYVKFDKQYSLFTKDGKYVKCTSNQASN